jgi:uncharacterized membrane protein
MASAPWSFLRVLSPLVLLWLAYFFGRTLRRGATPLIERIARQSTPALSGPLCRYTRWLTAVWCAYFVVAAALAAFAPVADAQTAGRVGAGVWIGTLVLFIGEWGLRPLFFPNENFPGLLQQLRDTWQVWRPTRKPPGD